MLIFKSSITSIITKFNGKPPSCWDAQNHKHQPQWWQGIPKQMVFRLLTKVTYVGGVCVPAVGTPHCDLAPEADSHWRSRSWWMTLSQSLQQPTWPPSLANKGDGHTCKHTHGNFQILHIMVLITRKPPKCWCIVSLSKDFPKWQGNSGCNKISWVENKASQPFCVFRLCGSINVKWSAIIVTKCSTNTDFILTHCQMTEELFYKQDGLDRYWI